MREGTDSVHVTVSRRVVQPGVIRLLAAVDQRYQLTQRERIVLSLVVQTEGVSAVELAEQLGLPAPAPLRSWARAPARLGPLGADRPHQGTRYFVPPALLREAGLDKVTTLERVQPHRLRALILEDLERFPDSGRASIHRRIGPEIHPKTITRTIDALIGEGVIVASGERRWRAYRVAPGKGQQP